MRNSTSSSNTSNHYTSINKNEPEISGTGVSAPATHLFMIGTILAFVTELSPVCTPGPEDNAANTGGLEQSLKMRQYNEFIVQAQKNPWYSSSKNELLLNLDSGIAEVFSGNHESGTKKLIMVGELGEEYYTKSVTQNILSVLTNDRALPYYGEDYELTFAGNAAALAYVSSGSIEDALVEVRRSEHRLSVISSAYEGSDKYSDDAFAHYLAGLLYEASGNYNDAVVSYKNAYTSYGSRFFPMRPQHLTRALIGASVAGNIDPGFGFQTLKDSLSVTDPEIAIRVDPDSSAAYINNTMIIIAFTGRGPKKVENVLSAHFTDKGVDYLIKIALPDIVRRDSSIASVQFRLDDGDRRDMELAADYNHIGVNAFNDKRTFIYLKTVARVSARYLLMREAKEKSLKELKEKYEKAKEKNGEDSDEAKNIKLQIRVVSLAMDMLANELLEHADTRCSLIIPGKVFVARVPVKADSHHVKIEYLDSRGDVLDTQERAILFRPGKGHVELFTALF